MNSSRCKMFESKITNGQLLMINTMIARLRLQASKEKIIAGFTEGRATQCKELYVNEATDIIRYLKAYTPADTEETVAG
ncbi:MAG: hypothetical protein EOP49_01820 [Sphingobacteriales bacterium]|nr:MAG: hypothetical protein EOP49_01820 [Sphingobacteriales bacterium]